MNDSIHTILVNLIPGFIIAVITAFVTVQLSMKQFYSQRWWEKKAEAYSQIIEQLSYLQYFYGEWFNHATRSNILTLQEREKLTIKFQQAKESITRAAAIGNYVISSETIQALEKLLCELEKESSESDWIGDLDQCYDETKKCIKAIREYAKDDLASK